MGDTLVRFHHGITTCGVGRGWTAAEPFADVAGVNVVEVGVTNMVPTFVELTEIMYVS